MKPPEEVKRELVCQWLAKAEDDFRVAEHLVTEGAYFLGAVGFHAQQAAEKFLKALLVWHQVEFPKTHDLDELLDLAATVDSHLAESFRPIVVLTPYGVDARYPSDFPRITPVEAKKAVELATQARKIIRDALKECI